jgi:hypothetical protein
MIRVLFVVDGPRDHHIVPPLVIELLRAEIDPETRVWTKLHLRGERVPKPFRGYAHKLRYALTLARTRGLAAVVATVDTDRGAPRERLRKLREGRERDRQKHPPLPAALGEANPHAEVWLLDDATAVREALGLAPETNVPAVKYVEIPKEALDQLVAQSTNADQPSSTRDTPELLRSIAGRVQRDRCPHAKQTGFHAFAEDVRTELGPLLTPAST